MTRNEHHQLDTLADQVWNQMGLLATSSSSSSSSSSTSGWITAGNVIAVVATLTLIRSHWSSMPEWVRNARNKSSNSNSNNNNDDTSRTRSFLQDANDELANPTAILGKLKDMMALTSQLCDDATPDELTNWQIMAAGYALLHLHKEYHAMDPEYHHHMYNDHGSQDDVSKDEVEVLLKYLDYAHWAYEPSHTEISLKCRAEGLDLLRHDTATEPGRVGHYIALNHTAQQAIIGLKGTSTLSDVLTDLIALPKPHDCPFDNDHFNQDHGTMVCHEGIHTSAIWMADDIQPLIEHLLIPLHYKVILVGHSLGAGCACLLGLELRARIAHFRTNYDDLRVYAYASPPVVSYAASQACAPFVTTVVNNADVIPRSSLSNMVVMNKLLIHVNDKLARKGLTSTTWSSMKQFYDDVSQVDDNVLLTTQELDDFFRETHAAPEEEKQSLFVPGRVIALWDKGDNHNDDNEDNHSSIGGIVTDCGMKMLRQIELSTSLVSDHGVESYRTNMTKLVKQLNHSNHPSHDKISWKDGTGQQ